MKKIVLGVVGSCLLSAWLISSAMAQQRGPEAPAAQTTRLLDLNAATEWELQSLPGIGAAKARAILEVRQRMGRFRRTEDILRVRGIGRATLRRLRSMVTVETATEQNGTTEESQRSAPSGARVPR